MFGIIFVGHGQIAKGAVSALELFGCVMDNGCKIVEFLPGDSLDTFSSKLECALDSLSNYAGVVVFADLFSGSPFNMAVRQKLIRTHQRIEVIGGANLTAVLEAFVSRDEDMDEVVLRSIDLGKRQLKRYLPKGGQEPPTIDDDI